MKSNSDESVLPGNENGGAKAFDIVSAIPDIEENKYYFLIKKCPAPVQPYIMVDNGKQKKKYNGSSNMADTVRDTSSVPIDYADYLSMPISEEDAKAMHIFQERVSAFLAIYNKSDTNNQNLNNMSNVENVKTKNESDESGSESSKENQKELKNTAEDISQSLDDIVKAIKNSAIVESATKNLEEFNSHILSSSSKESKEHNVTLDNVKIIDTLLRRHKSIVTLIKDIDGLMNELNKALVTLTKQSKLSQVEEKILTKIISIFWQILKSGGKISNSKDMEKCFKRFKLNCPIKIGAALCLSYLIDSSCASHVELHTYLKEAHNSNQNFDIFSDEDIQMGFGKISLNPESDLSKNSTTRVTSSGRKKDAVCHEVGSVAVTESSFMDTVSPEDYERCFLVVTGNMMPLLGEDSIRCIEISLKMKDKRIITNLIAKSDPIDFEEQKELCAKIIDMNNGDVLSSLLSNCVTSEKHSEMLLDLVINLGSNFAELVGTKLAGMKVTGAANKKALSLAFGHLQGYNQERFKTFIEVCSDHNEYLDEKDTLLTKMLQELDSSLVAEAVKLCQFDVNLCDKSGESPICIACHKADETKVDLLIEISERATTPIKDVWKAIGIVSKVCDQTVGKPILKKLNNIS